MRLIVARSLWKEILKTTSQFDAVGSQILYFAADRYRWFQQHYSPLWCDALYASTPQRVEFLNSKGFPALYTPLGYHPIWGSDLNMSRDIDVLFIGDDKDVSRRVLLKRVRKELASNGVQLVVAAGTVYSHQREVLLNRTKIVIDIMKTPWEMPVLRLLMCFGCKALVVSNWTSDPSPFTNEHFVRTPTEELVAVVMHYLHNDSKRQIIVNKAHEFVTRNLNMSKCLKTMLYGMKQRQQYEIRERLEVK